MFLVNSPTSIYVPWKVAKQFLEENTIQKIKIFKNCDLTDLFIYTNKEQIEKKFGGNANDLETFWPPHFPSKNYFINNEDKKKLISKKEYYKLYEDNLLSKNKINYDYIEEFTKKKIENSKLNSVEKKIETQIENPNNKNHNNNNKNKIIEWDLTMNNLFKCNNLLILYIIFIIYSY